MSKESGAMRGIGWAVKEMQDGKRVCRSGWNGKGMWLALMRGSQWDLSPDLESKLSSMGSSAMAGYAYRGSFVAIRAADGMLVPWGCSQSDLLATDWELASRHGVDYPEISTKPVA